MSSYKPKITSPIANLHHMHFYTQRDKLQMKNNFMMIIVCSGSLLLFASRECHTHKRRT